MAVKTTTTLVDDIEGSEIQEGAGGTVSFSLEGLHYEIDLSDKNKSKMVDAFQFYIDHGRKVGGRAKKAASGAGPKNDLAAIRAWAKANGHKVSDRGRVAAEVREAYYNAEA